MAGSDAQLKKLVDAATTIRSLHQIEYELGRLRQYRDALMDKCPYQPGMRVMLNRTPIITPQKSWGWMGYRDRLVQGAIGKVMGLDWNTDRKDWTLGVKFEGLEVGPFSMASKWFSPAPPPKPERCGCRMANLWARRCLREAQGRDGLCNWCRQHCTAPHGAA